MDIDLDEPSDTGFDIGSSMDKVADSLGLRGASGVLPTADHSEAGAVLQMRTRLRIRKTQTPM